MVYFKVFNIERKAFWLQSKYGYTFDESSAGQWTLEQIAVFADDCAQIIIPSQLSKEQVIKYLGNS